MPRSRRRKLISLFTGAGGLDFGFEAAGFETAVALEMDEDCCRTIAKNRAWPIIQRRIEAVPSKEILATAGVRSGGVDLLIGGPPCQPFSKSAYWSTGDTKRLADPRARTLHEFMRCVGDLLPEVFLLENVHGISYSGKEEGFGLLERMTARINRRHRTSYQLSWRVLNAVEFGVPQLRQRFFLVAHREGRRFVFPEETHRVPDGPSSEQSGKIEPLTAWDAIGDLKLDSHEVGSGMSGRWADLLPSIPEGENYLWHTSRKGGLPLFGWRSRYWSFLLKLAKNRPSWTIQAQPGPAIGPFHWANRRLSIREMARLQTFPDEIEFFGGRGSVQRQLGNAVPSLLAEILAREIGRQLLDQEPKGPLKLALTPRRPIPRPEPPRRVPTKYHALSGDHPDYAPRYLQPRSSKRPRVKR
jgi:DNA (cytosine-5)-methyltransferase 1